MGNAFVFYKNYYEAMRKLEDKDLAILLRAICDYVYDGVVPELTGMCDLAFSLIAPMVTASCRKYERAKAGAQARWNPEDSPSPKKKPEATPGGMAEQASSPAPAKTVETDPPLPRNVHLTDEQRDALRREIPDADRVIRRYGRYKEDNLFNYVLDKEAIPYFAKHGSVPKDAFLPAVSPAQRAIERLKKEMNRNGP